MQKSLNGGYCREDMEKNGSYDSFGRAPTEDFTCFGARQRSTIRITYLGLVPGGESLAAARGLSLFLSHEVLNRWMRSNRTN